MSWKNKLGWIAIFTLGLIVLVVVAGFFILRSSAFHNYVLAKIEQTAGEATGGQVQIQNFDWHLSTLSADVYGITIHGTEPRSTQPLVQADQLTVRLKIVSLLRKKVDLREIVLRHPVVNLRVKKDGTTNLPTPPKSKSDNSTNVFDLGIRHVLLNNGEVYYNDAKTPLDAELHDLQLEIKSEYVSNRYDGTLRYRDGRINYGNTKSLPHDLNASFNATPSEFTLKPLVLTVASSTIEISGNVHNYSSPVVKGNYKITIHPQDFRPVLKNPSIPNGEVTLAGAVHYQYEEQTPLLRTLVLDGKLDSRELAVNSADLRTSIRNVRGRFRLLNGSLDLRELAADLLDGHLIAVGTIQLDSKPVSKLRASMQGISLGAAKAALRTASLGQIPIEGHISGTAEASWVGSVQNIKARSDVTLNAAITQRSSGASPIPLSGAVHANYDGRTKTASLVNTFLRTPQIRVDLRGTAGQRFNLTANAHAADLREINALLAPVEKSKQPVQAKTPASSTNIAGAADAHVIVQGSMNDPRIHGQINGRNLRVQNTDWRSLDLELQASKSGVSIENGSLVNARQGYLNFAVSSTLSNWHYLPSSQINANVNSRGLAIQQLLQAAKLNYPVSGNLLADISIHGSQLKPVGRGSVRLAQARVYGQPLQQFSVQFEGNGDSINSLLNVSTIAGSAKANLVFNPKSKGYDLRLDAPGIQLAKLQPVQERNVGIAGVLTLTASGRGTLDDPQLTANVQVPQLQIRQASIYGMRADLKVANHQAQLALDSEVAKTLIRARSTVNLSPGYYTQTTFDTQGIPIEGLLALYTTPKTNGPRGVVELHASASGPLSDKARMHAQVLIPTLKADYRGLQIGNTRPIRVRYSNFVVVLDPTAIAGTDTNLRLGGQLPLQGSAPATLSAVGSVDMKLLRFFQPDIQSSGKVLLDVRGTKVDGQPQLSGQVRIQSVNAMFPDAPLGIQNLNGVLDISNDKVNITNLTGESGGGKISATGVVGYRPELQMNVALQVNGVRVRYQDAIRTVLDGDLNLVGTSEAANLTGRVLIDSLSFTPNFDLATLAGEVQSGPESMPSEGLAQNIKLNIAVQTAQGLNLASSEVSLQGQANLRVIGTAADPVIVGRTEFTAGDIFLMNKRYKIERGIIEFSNPNRTEPVLNVLLTTTINQYNLSLTFLGPLDKLQTNYVSDPQLPTADIINLIARGQTTQQAAASPSNLGASSLLAQGAASQVSSGIQKLAGFSSFSIDPTLGGNNANPGARIAFQKRVTSNLFLTFASDVTSTQREIIQGEYQINRRWSASVTRDENGGFAVDGKYHKRF